MQVQRPINDRALDRWRDFEEQLSEVIAYLRRRGLTDDEGADGNNGHRQGKR